MILADAIGESADRESFVAFLHAQLNEPYSRPGLLAGFILARLIQTLSGEQQIDVAVRSLQRMEPLRKGTPLRDLGDVDDPLSSANVQAISKKPESKKTAQRASATLLAAMAEVSRPEHVQIAWFGDAVSVSTSARQYQFADRRQSDRDQAKHLQSLYPPSLRLGKF